jgi:hypothetical protein
MSSEAYVDIFGAKDRIVRILRETGSQPYSRLLMSSQLPEDMLSKVLELLEREHKVKVQGNSQSGVEADPTYLPANGTWALSGSKR